MLAYSSKVVAGTVTYSETVSGTAHFSHARLINCIASVCNTNAKEFWVTRTSSTFYLQVGVKGSGSAGSPVATWHVGAELTSANNQKIARDIINRQRVFGAGDGINQISVCVPYIDINVVDDARHQGFDGTNASCTHAAATASQTAVGVMEGEPYYNASIIDTSMAIAYAKAILTASLGDAVTKLSANCTYYLTGVVVGDYVRVVDSVKGIDTTSRLKKITRKISENKMVIEFLSTAEGIEDVLAAVQRSSNFVVS